MSKFQQGSLFRLERRSCPDVWVFRWYENISGKRTYKKRIIGSTVDLRNRRDAEKAVTSLRSSINADVGTPKSIGDLAAHYRLHELTKERKAFSTIENHRVLFKRYIEPRWGDYQLSAVRTMEVEEWLHSLALAPSSKAKLKCTLSTLNNHAIRYKWLTFNPSETTPGRAGGFIRSAAQSGLGEVANASPIGLGHLDGGRSSPHVQVIQPFIFLLLVADVVPDRDLIATDG